MGGSLGVATLSSEFDPTGLQSGLAGAYNFTQGFLGRFQDIWDRAISWIIANVIMRMVEALANVAKQAFDAAASFQTLNIQMQGLMARQLVNTGVTNNFTQAMQMAVAPAQQLVGWIKQMSVTTPFTVQALQNVVSMSMAMGFTSDQAKDMTMAIGNFSAGMGLSGEVMQRIIYNFGQMRMQGKVTGTELRDLARGSFVPIDDVLVRMQQDLGLGAMKFDDFKKAASEGKVPVDAFFKAFIEIANEQFPGAMARMSATWQGVTSNITDFIQSVIGGQVILPVLDKMALGLRGLLDTLLKPENQLAFTTLSESLAHLVDSLFGKKLDFSGIVSGIMNGVTGLTDAVNKIIGLIGLVKTFGFDALYKYFFDKEIGVVPQMVAHLGSSVRDIGEAIGNWLKDTDWHKVGKAIADGINSINWNKVGMDFGAAATAIGDGLGKAVKTFDWGDVAKSLVDAFMGAVAGAFFGASWDQIKSTWKSNLTNLNAPTISPQFLPLLGQGLAGAMAQPNTINEKLGVTSDIDWSGMLKAAMDFQLGVQSAFKNADAAVGQFRASLTNFAMSIIGSFGEAATNVNNWCNQINAQLAAAPGQFQAAITGWSSQIEDALRQIGKIFFDRATGWVTQAALAIQGNAGKLVLAVQGLINQIAAIVQSAAFSIGITLDLPGLGPLQSLLGRINALLGGGGGKGGGGSVGEKGGTQSGATGAHTSSHTSQSGGSFIVPTSYGYEGFKLGNFATASAGEEISINPLSSIPGNGGKNGNMVFNFKDTTLDEEQLLNIQRRQRILYGRA